MGVRYRERINPVNISVLKEDTYIRPSESDLWRGVPDKEKLELKGTIIKDDRVRLSDEDFEKYYEPYKNEKGEIVEGMYTPLVYVKAIKNPYDKPIRGYGQDCFIVQRNGWTYLDVISANQLEEYYYKEEEPDRIEVQLNSAALKDLIKREGKLYKRRSDNLYDIRITQEEEIVKDFLSRNITVPPGTPIEAGQYIREIDEFEKEYEPALDEDGNVLQGKYRKIEYVKAIPNPFERPIFATGWEGDFCGKYDENCYFIGTSFKTDVMSSELFNKRCVKVENKHIYK